MAKQRITEAIIYEAYFDLWGFSVELINIICNDLLNFAHPSKGDDCEAYRNEACMAVRFQSTNKVRVEQAKKLYRRLESRAEREVKGRSEDVYYSVVCG